ncbi:hypothetical protein [Acidianus sp. HS-5]|uniref:hypothetical protein n=1 Tax=Acidianus sp. HS-5 TaxID=2886040 RepID=UPI001F15C07B|nr:hypothetical protein [Acidianus sp. HS-5]BDC19833.1 hypothetical protein HS5_27230 [Acidianus sp. HS-5]
MSYEIIKDPLIRGILALTIIFIAVLIALLAIDIYLSVIEGKLIISGVTRISDLFGYIITGVLILGWGFFVPIYFASKGWSKRYIPRDIAEAIDMYYRGLLSRDELIQIIDRYKH